jgi:hypothetical protein
MSSPLLPMHMEQQQVQQRGIYPAVIQKHCESLKLASLGAPIAAMPHPFLRTESGREIPEIAPALDDLSMNMSNMNMSMSMNMNMNTSSIGITCSPSQEKKKKKRHCEKRPQGQHPSYYAMSNPVMGSDGILASHYATTTEEPVHEMDAWTLLSNVGKSISNTISSVSEGVASVFAITEPRYSMYLDEAMEYELGMLEDREKRLERSSFEALFEEDDEIEEWRMNQMT